MTDRYFKRVVGLTAPAAFNRAAALARLAEREFDVLVVGGGITGASVALDAATRGLSVAMVEQADFASGTSSASSKMIHGGLRYIEQREFRIVAQSLLERQRMYQRAPHLVSRLPFLFPIYRSSGVFGPTAARAFRGLLWAYDAVGGWRIGRLHRRMGEAETLTHCPTLDPNGLIGGLLYYDTRTDDARLTLGVARTAALFGATVVNGCEVTGLGPGGSGRAREVTLQVRSDDGSSRQVRTRARVVVNAAGVWSDRIGQLAGVSAGGRIRPAKGVHVVVPWAKVRSQSTLVFPMLGGLRGKGGRAFVVRWGDHCYIGTTDTPYDGPLEDPRCTREEAQLLLDSLNDTLTTDLTLADVSGSWAGLRPLIDTGSGDTAELSREHEITVADGVVRVAGGKLTVARAMAQEAVDEVCRLLDRRRRCVTSRVPLVGGAGFDAEAVEATGGRLSHLAGRYGTEARFVEDIALTEPGAAEPITEGMPYLWAEAIYAVRHEMARTVSDVLVRRIPIRFLDSARAGRAAPALAQLLQRELGTPPAELERQVADLIDDIERERGELSAL